MNGEHANGSPEPAAWTDNVGALIYLIFGAIVWAAHLAVLYATQSVACAISVPSPTGGSPVATGIISVATFLAFGLLVLALAAPRRLSAGLSGAARWSDTQRDIYYGISRGLAALSILAVATQTLVVVIVPFCADLR